MNKIKISILSLILMVATTSCEDFLDLAPVTQTSTESFYRNAEDMDNALASVYSAFGTRFYELGRTVLFMTSSDDSQWNRIDAGFDNSRGNFDQYNVLSTEGALNSLFSNGYVTIMRANALLDNIDVIADQPEVRNRIEGEARFLRAYTYFDLIRAFGRVPLTLSQITDRDEGFLPLSSADEVYQQGIIPDLQFAATNLPLRSATDLGRATKGSAQTLLAKVYLTRGNNSEAETLLRAVIGSGEYALLPEFDNLWDPTNRNSAESIFELQYSAPVAGGTHSDNWISNSMAEHVWPGAQFSGQSQVMPTKDLINAFEANDIRLSSTLRLGFDIDGDGAISGLAEEIPFQWKQRAVPTLPLNVDENFIRLRYADALLMLAEALGETTESWDLIDQIRSRAGLPAVDRGQNFVDALAQERRVELAFENHRWHDLKRLYGEAGTASILESQINTQLRDEGFNFTVNVGAENLSFPLPQIEVDLNGWDD